MAKNDKNKKTEKKKEAPKKAPKKDVGKDKVPKVTPSKDKGQNSNDLQCKALKLLKNHPQVTNNSRGLFRNENGKTIVEEIVHRGDARTQESIMPRNQGDLTDDDLRSLSVHASTMVNKEIAKYDPVLASEEALSMAIRTKDGGKYDGKVNASTFQLILDDMKGMKKTAEEDTSRETGGERGKRMTQKNLDNIREVSDESQGDTSRETGGETGGERGKRKTRENLEEIRKKRTKPNTENIYTPEEEGMNKETLKKAKESLLRKLAALDELMGEDKEAGEEDQVEVGTPGGDPSEDDHNKDQPKNISDITSSLDEIAGELEEQKDPELFKMAYQLDQISDILEGRKEAATFESDPDEKFMKTFFKGGIHEGDSDEKYMKEFNTDLTSEVNSVKDKKNGKEASEKLPYQIVD